MTGGERSGSPVEITASVDGDGDGAVNGVITFDPLMQLNRVGLLLNSGAVYIAFGSHADLDPYHGWVIAYNAATLDQLAVYNTTPDGGRGSIWQSGQGLVGSSDGSIYLVTANGTCDSASNCGRNLGESFIRLTSLLTPTDWFTPSNRAFLDGEDLDFGSGGPILIPGTNLLAAAGKDGILRVVDSANMGKFNLDADQDLQEFQATPYAFLGAPIYWNSPVNGPSIYMWGGGDNMKAFQLSGGRFEPAAVLQSAVQTPPGLSNTAPLSLSANGAQPATAIIWASCPVSGNANTGPAPGELCAFDASDLSVELWDSNMSPDRDAAGTFAKFCPPTIAGGKVYLATFSGQLNVYGLMPSCSVSLSQSQQAMLPTGGSGQINVTAADDCSWTATTDASFITIDAGASGIGSGTINYSVSANAGPPRSGAIEVADQILTVTQDSGCSFTIEPLTVEVKWKGGSYSLSIQEIGSCSWTANSDVSWITIATGDSGSASGTVSITVSRNPDKFSDRTGHVIVGGTTFTVVQRAKHDS
jgi:hypothetical protein